MAVQGYAELFSPETPYWVCDSVVPNTPLPDVDAPVRPLPDADVPATPLPEFEVPDTPAVPVLLDP